MAEVRAEVIEVDGPGRDGRTDAVREVYERLAPRYDTMVAFWERVLFSGGREWVCARDPVLREPLEDVSAAGFHNEEVERRRLGIVELLSARKPAGDEGGS